MSKLSKRVVLIHELRQRRGTEKFLDSRSDRTDIDKALRSDSFHFLSLDIHSFLDDSFHSRKADPELILEQLAYRTDTSVSEVVDIIDIADTFAEVKEIADSCIDIIKNDMLGNEFVSTLLYHFLQLVRIGCCAEDIAQYLERNLFIDSVLSCVEAYIRCDIDHAVAYDLYLTLFNSVDNFACGRSIGFLMLNVYPRFHYACLLDLASLAVRNSLALFSKDLACQRICNRSGQIMSGKS